MLLKLLIKRTSRDSETFCGLLDPPSFLLQYPLDVLLFELKKRQAGVEKCGAYLRVPIEVKIAESDLFLVTQQHRAFDYVAQFTDVAGP